MRVGLVPFSSQRATSRIRKFSPGSLGQRIQSQHAYRAGDTTTQGRAFMNKLTIPVVLVATGVVAATAWSQTVTLSLLNKRYFTTPLENDPTREVGLQSVLMPPGGGNEFHRHPGNQWTAIQEGEITYTIRGQPPQVLKAGDSNYVPRGTIHRQQNLSDKPARYIEMRIFDKGKPPSEVIGDTAPTQ